MVGIGRLTSPGRDSPLLTRCAIRNLQDHRIDLHCRRGTQTNHKDAREGFPKHSYSKHGGPSAVGVSVYLFVQEEAVERLSACLSLTHDVARPAFKPTAS